MMKMTIQPADVHIPASTLRLHAKPPVWFVMFFCARLIVHVTFCFLFLFFFFFFPQPSLLTFPYCPSTGFLSPFCSFPTISPRHGVAWSLCLAQSDNIVYVRLDTVLRLAVRLCNDIRTIPGCVNATQMMMIYEASDAREKQTAHENGCGLSLLDRDGVFVFLTVKLPERPMKVRTTPGTRNNGWYPI